MWSHEVVTCKYPIAWNCDILKKYLLAANTKLASPASCQKNMQASARNFSD